ncbi:MAG: AMP-binding protein [Gammaproteobacteria bacterium]
MNILPVAKMMARVILRTLFRVRVRGMEHLESAGPKALIVANHTSFLDAPIMVAFLPGRFTFAINTHQASRWWIRPLVKWFDLFPLDPTHPMAIKSFTEHVRAGNVAAVFPEGRITVTGGLMKMYDGPGLVADKADAPLVPLHIEGAQFSKVSRMQRILKLRWFPRITLTFHPPVRLELPAALKGAKRRAMAGERLAHVMAEAMVNSYDRDRGFVAALVEARALHGGGKEVAMDIEYTPFTYNSLLTRSFIAGKLMERRTGKGDRVGVLLPTSAGTVAVFLGLQLFGRIPAMLNFTSGAAGMISACETAELETVFTSHRFVDKAELQKEVDALAQRVKVIYLDDLRPEVGLGMKLAGLLKAHFPGYFARRGGGMDARGDDPAVVLFTSGSEGVPKGVVLSHANLLANHIQIRAVVDINAADTMFNCLPVFHSFGLMGGIVLPLLVGARTFHYPSPLHYRIIPEAIYEQNATVLFATNTFLKGYAKHAHPYDFRSLRYVVAGAERLKDDTRRDWVDRFGIRIIEGYGATETAPVLSANTPMEVRYGTVGRLFPCVEHRLAPVPGIMEGGELVVRGPNVMLGYLHHNRPGVLEPPCFEGEPGWYATGDVVTLDANGFVTIKDRAKRFAKVGGEMVSLTMVEELAGRVWPEFRHAATALPDDRKGEQIVLLTDNPTAHREDLLRQAQRDGIAELAVPRTLLIVEEIPLLGTGKTDFGGVKHAASARLEVRSAL